MEQQTRKKIIEIWPEIWHILYKNTANIAQGSIAYIHESPTFYEDGMGREADQQYHPDREKRGTKLSEFLILHERSTLTPTLLNDLTQILNDKGLISGEGIRDAQLKDIQYKNVVELAKGELEALDKIYKKQTKARELVQSIEELQSRIRTGNVSKFKYEFSGLAKPDMDRIILSIFDQIDSVEAHYYEWIKQKTAQNTALEASEDLNDFISMLMDDEELSCTRTTEINIQVICRDIGNIS